MQWGLEYFYSIEKRRSSSEVPFSYTSSPAGRLIELRLRLLDRSTRNACRPLWVRAVVTASNTRSGFPSRFTCSAERPALEVVLAGAAVVVRGALGAEVVLLAVVAARTLERSADELRLCMDTKRGSALPDTSSLPFTHLFTSFCEGSFHAPGTDELLHAVLEGSTLWLRRDCWRRSPGREGTPQGGDEDRDPATEEP